MDDVIDDPSDLTGAWLSAALQGAGHDVTVVDVAYERVGSGQMGRTYRLRPVYKGAEGPTTLIAKLAGEHEATRALVAPGYAAEVGFYNSLAQDLEIRTPACFYGAISDHHTRFTLILEDMFPATPGVQAQGCTVAQARSSLHNMIGLHVPRWSDPRLFEVPFLMRPDPGTATVMAEVMSNASDAFVERYAGELAPEDGETLRSACGVIERWQLTDADPFAIIHGDYRLDNLMFDSARNEVTVVDWQSAAIGPPLRDVAYFLGTSLRSDDRRSHEEDLVAEYHAGLVGRGITGYSADECWRDYRLGQLQGPMITVIGCIYASGIQTADTDAMFLAMARRSCAAVRELRSVDLL